MNIVIIGAGAIGLLLYKKLQDNRAANHELSISTKDNNPPQHYYYQHADGHESNIKLNIATTEHIKKAQVIFICVKAYQVNQVITQYSDEFSANASIILSHNGMGVYDSLPAHIKQNQAVYALLTTHGSFKRARWSIKHTGQGGFDFGLLSKNASATTEVQQWLEANLTHVMYHQNINLLQWQKLAINCVINPITAIHAIKNGQVLSEKYHTLREQLIDEFIGIAQLEGVDFNRQQLIEKIKAVATNTAENSSSMLCDVIANRKTEIDFINGYLVEVAIKHKKPKLCQHHQHMVQQVNRLLK